MKFKLTCLLLLVAVFLLPANFPKAKGWINDYAGVLTNTTKTRLTDWSTEVKEKTGVEIAVAVVSDLDGMDYREYAVKLFEQWGIGNNKDEGVLVLLAPKERKAKIEVGYGSEGYITDAAASDVFNAMKKFLADNRWNDGLTVGVAMLAERIAAEHNVKLTGSSKYFTSVKESKTRRPAPRKKPSRKAKSGGLAGAVIFIILAIVTRGRIVKWVIISALINNGHRGGFGGFGGGSSGFGGGSNSGSSGGGFSGFGGFGGFGGGSSGGGGAGGSF